MILLCWMSKISITCPANVQPSFDIADTLCWSGEVRGHSSLQLPAVLHNRHSWTPTHSHCSRVYCAGGWLWQCTGGSQQRSRQTVRLLASGDSGHLTQCWLKSRGNTHHCLWRWVRWCTCESVWQSVCSFYFGFPTVALCPIFLSVPVCLSVCVCHNVCLPVSATMSVYLCLPQCLSTCVCHNVCLPVSATMSVYLCLLQCLSTCVCHNVCLPVSATMSVYLCLPQCLSVCFFVSLLSCSLCLCRPLFVWHSLSFPLSPLLLSLFLSVWLPVFSSLCAFLLTSLFFVSSLFGHQQTISFKIQMHKLLKRN